MINQYYRWPHTLHRTKFGLNSAVHIWLLTYSLMGQQRANHLVDECKLPIYCLIITLQIYLKRLIYGNGKRNERKKTKMYKAIWIFVVVFCLLSY